MLVYQLDKSPKRELKEFLMISLVELKWILLRLKHWKEQRTKMTLIKNIIAPEEN